MDFQKAANISQVLSVVPGYYCGYAAWIALHPPVPVAGASPAVDTSANSTWFLVSLGAFAALMVLGIVLRLLSPKEPDPGSLVIHYARYGIGTHRWQYNNVTDIVRGHIKDRNAVDMIAGYQSFGDPFYGKPKYTHIKYSLGGVTRVVSLRDGERLVIPERTGGESRPSPKLKLHSAFYGTGQLNDVEVSEKVLKNSTDGLVIPVENHLLVDSDPAPNKPKRLRIVYSYGNDKRWETSRAEGTRLILPEDFELMKWKENQHAREIAAMRDEHREDAERRVTELQTQIDSLKQTTKKAAASPQINLVYAKPDPLAPEADYPSKVRCELQNLSTTESVKVRVAEWIPGISGLHAKLPGRTLQLRIAGDWWPKPDGAEEVHAPPLEFFHLWIAPSGHSTIDELQRWLTAGQLGTLVLIANENRVEIRL